MGGAAVLVGRVSSGDFAEDVGRLLREGLAFGSVDEGELEVWFGLVGSPWLLIGKVRLDRCALIVRRAVSISLR